MQIQSRNFFVRHWTASLWTVLIWAMGALLVSEAEQEKSPATTKPHRPGPGLEIPAESVPFIEIATVGPLTNAVWSRPIPGHVSLQTSARISVGALVDGRVEEVLVRPGDCIQAGARLARLQSLGGGQARAEAEQAVARLEAAEDSLRRHQTMLARGVGTELELVEAELHAKEARIDAERTRQAGVLLGSGRGPQMVVVAPTNGVVLAIPAAVGSVVAAGNVVVELGDPSRLWIETDVSEEDAARLTVGQRARVDSRRPGCAIEATVELLTGQLDPATRRRRVYLKHRDENISWLTLGLPVDVRLSEPPDQLTLPVEAVLIKEGKRRIVYVQSPDGRLRAREVVVSPASPGRVRVLEGIAPGERVVVKGALLVDGRSEQLL
jgi:cobalt-zinc-cadmium efflux system membrane fusion protein